MCTINEDHIWFMKYKVQHKIFFHFGTFFALSLPQPPPDNLENQNFEKLKKYLDILPFYTCVPKMTII